MSSLLVRFGSLRIRTWLAHRRLPVAIALIAVALMLPFVNAGLQFDDYLFRLVLLDHFGRGSPRISELKQEFFSLDTESDRNRWLTDMGVLPWWTSERWRVAPVRPLASGTHWLDYRLWPDKPAFMHLHSLAWFGALVASAAVYYRSLMGVTWCAGMAAVLFALDDSHSLPAGWVANRNALIASFFGVLALAAHHRWRRAGWRPGAWLSPVFLAAALAAYEGAAAVMGFLVSYALFLDQASMRRRLLTLVPSGAVVMGWAIALVVLGFWAQESALYTDPLREPFRFLAQIGERAPVLLLGQWALPPSDVYPFLSARPAQMMWGAAIVFLGILTALMLPLLLRDALARFWALGMLFAVLPICATFPSDRLLAFVALGAMGLFAHFLAGLLDGAAWVPTRRSWKIGAQSLCMVLVLIHLGLAPLLLPLGYKLFAESARAFDRSTIGAHLGPDVERRQVVIVNAPLAGIGAYLIVRRVVENESVPRNLRVLASGPEAVEVSRVDERTLVVRQRGGYLGHFNDALFRNSPVPLGYRRHLSGLEIEITALTEDGRPAEVTFRFDVELEDPSLVWLQWHRSALESFTPPEVGETIVLPGAVLT